MKLREHFSISGIALRRWFIVQLYDALAVGVLWLIGLMVLQVPIAPVWALLAAILQLIPVLGTTLALIAPAAAAAIGGGVTRLVYVLILYAAINVIDGLVLQPLLMRRSARVPLWASVLAPLMLGSLFGIWGVVLSLPLLAVIYAYREYYRKRS
jgi:predicted PurR-regulated permease PerM